MPLTAARSIEDAVLQFKSNPKKMADKASVDGFPICIPFDPFLRTTDAQKNETLISVLKRHVMNPQVSSLMFTDESKSSTEQCTGSWSIGGCSRDASNSTCGTKRKIQCTCDATGRTHQCSWWVKYEYTVEGWVLYNYAGAIHSPHTLLTSRAHCNAVTGGCHFPEKFGGIDVLELGTLLGASGLPAKTINHIFCSAARSHSLEMTWNYKMVYDKFVNVGVDHQFDASGYLKLLVQRERSAGLRYFADTDVHGSLDRVFVEMPRALHTWALGGRNNVLLVDPTHGTNRYGMKLTMFISITESGSTVILAYMIHHREDVADVLWGFECFDLLFIIAPRTIFTDSGAALLAGIQRMLLKSSGWESSTHLLCLFHVHKNFYEHIRPILAGNHDKWLEANDVFWRLGKDSEFGTLNFDDYFDRLRTLINEHGRGNTKGAAMQWLEGTQYERRQMWGACFTWQHFTGGMHGTGRSESAHSAIKSIPLACSTFVTLHSHLTAYVDNRDLQASIFEIRQQHRNSSTIRRQKRGADLSSHYPPWLLRYLEKMCPYARHLVEQQFAQSMKYQDQPMMGGRADVLEYTVYSESVICEVSSRDAAFTPMRLTGTGEVACYECNHDEGYDDDFRNARVTREGPPGKAPPSPTPTTIMFESF